MSRLIWGRTMFVGNLDVRSITVETKDGRVFVSGDAGRDHFAIEQGKDGKVALSGLWTEEKREKE